MKKKTAKKDKISVADLESLVEQGKDVTKHFDFANVKVREGIPKSNVVLMQTQRVNVDFNSDMLKEIDAICDSMAVSRQGWIKIKLREILDSQAEAKSKKSDNQKPKRKTS